MSQTEQEINAQRESNGLPPLNFDLFRKVIEKLETSPEAYDQGDVARKDSRSPCGTAACIGGWADILSAPSERQKTARMAGHVSLARARDALGLASFSGLFAANPESGWPKSFAQQWRTATTARERSQAAIGYLTHIIKTGKVEGEKPTC